MRAKTFFPKLLVAICLGLFVPGLEMFLPLERFAFRGWEALLLQRRDRNLPGVFYPEQRLRMLEVGDLAPYSEKQIVKDVYWETDEFGYRNTRDCDAVNAILLGDSMAAGIALTQNETINEQIKKATGLCSFSFSHDSVEHALKALVRWQWKPRYVFLVRAERTLPELDPVPVIEYPPKQRRTKFLFQELGLNAPVTIFERMLHSNFSQYRAAHGAWAALRRFALPFHFVSGPVEKQRMLFFQGEDALRPVTDQYIKERADRLAEYKNAFADWGMKLVVVVVPNKESVYPELIPSSQRSDFFPRFYAALAQRNVVYADLWHPYREAFEKDRHLLYHLDDTHWTGEATALAAKIVSQTLSRELSRRTQ